MRIFFITSLFALIAGVFSGCENTKEEISNPVPERPSAEDLEIFVNIKENNYKSKSAYLTEISIQNNSIAPLKNDWTIYFHQPRKVYLSSVSENVKITHLSGDYFKLEPTEKFIQLDSGSTAIISYESSWWALKLVDAPVGLYIVFKDAEGKELSPQVLANVFYDPMLDLKQTQRSADDPLIVPTPTSRFVANNSLTFTDKEDVLPLIPTPLQYKKLVGEFALENATIQFPEELKNEGNFLIKQLKQDFGLNLNPVNENGQITLSIESKKGPSAKNEAYHLKVSDKKIQIIGSDNAGVFYGVQSLRNLVPVAAFTDTSKALVNAVEIYDAPRFSYRGMHLDVARNFQTKASVLKLIDLMALYKLNKFHFHITDDEGWRLEIKALPELTEIGAQRGYTQNEQDHLNPAYGSGPHPQTLPGSGFYTVEDFKEILAYAKSRHVEVIPELDFPGHARAAIISMRVREQRLREQGNEKEAVKYILHEANDASRYESVQLYDDNVVNVCQESTYTFLATVLDEIIEMYQAVGLDLKTVHIGGDEVPHPTKEDPDHGAWIYSPLCKKIIEQDNEFEQAEDLFYHFVDRFSKILEKRNIKTAGWEEIGMKKEYNEEEEEMIPVPNTKFLNRGFIPYVWNTVWGWGAEDRAYQLANAGYQVVLSNVNNLYFDLAYDKDPADPGYYWGGFVDTKKAWEFIPLDIYKGELVNNLGGPVDPEYVKKKIRLTDMGKQNIIGIQGQLWSETVKSQEMMEYYIFPKIFGLVERAWAQNPSWAEIEDVEKRKIEMEKAWNYFASKLGHYELPKLSYLNGGVNYRITVPGAVIQNDSLMVNHDYPGFVLRYTLDGSEPNEKSNKYIAPVAIDTSIKQIKVAAFDPKGRSSRVAMINR